MLCGRFNGLEGSLALLSRKEKLVEVFNYSRMNISAWIVNEEYHVKSLLTSFYAKPIISKRNNSWSLLDDLKLTNLCPWMVVGDFKEMIFHYDKIGRKPKNDNVKL